MLELIEHRNFLLEVGRGTARHAVHDPLCRYLGTHVCSLEDLPPTYGSMHGTIILLQSTVETR